jgi:hypothetical protein
MKPHRIKLVFAVVITALVFAVFSLIFWDFVRDTIVVPLYYLIWVVGLILNSIPQGIYLAGLIFISLIIGSNALHGIRGHQIVQKRYETPPINRARYTFWRRLHTYLTENRFSGNSFTWEARGLILAILAYQEGVDRSQVEEMIDDGTLHVPDAVKNVIQRKLMRTSQSIPGVMERFGLRLRQLLFKVDLPTDALVDQQVEEIVRFIEYRLEIPHAENQYES